MLYLLDTNAWLRWFHRPQELSQASRQILNAQDAVGLSPMSIVEVAQKHHKGKLVLPLPLDVWVMESMPTHVAPAAPASRLFPRCLSVHFR